MVSFKWRHWGVMQGPLRCPLGHGQELSASATGQKIQVCPLLEPKKLHCTSDEGALSAIRGQRSTEALCQGGCASAESFVPFSQHSGSMCIGLVWLWQCVVRRLLKNLYVICAEEPTHDLCLQSVSTAFDVVVQVYGMAVAVLDDDLRITKLEIFYGAPAELICFCIALEHTGCLPWPMSCQAWCMSHMCDSRLTGLCAVQTPRIC